MAQLSSSSEKLKNKGARGGESSGAPKIGRQLSPPPLNPALLHVRSDTTKPSQIGTFQVLNRDKNNDTSLSTKDGPTVSKVVNVSSLSPSASHLSLKSPTNQKPKVESKNEKRLHSQAKDRHEFFNFIRNKSLNSSSATPEQGPVSPSSSVVDSSDQSEFGVTNEKEGILSDSELKCSENGNCVKEDKEACEEFESPLPDNEEVSEPVDPEEEAFLRSLGWDENAVVDALTKEEIDAFNMMVINFCVRACLCYKIRSIQRSRKQFLLIFLTSPIAAEAKAEAKAEASAFKV